MIAKNSSVTKCKIISWTKSLMNNLWWCWWYGRKIVDLPGKVDKAVLEWEMSLVAGKAVNQINSIHYSLPKKMTSCVAFLSEFRFGQFSNGSWSCALALRRWRFTLIYGRGKTWKSLTDLFPAEGGFSQFSSRIPLWILAKTSVGQLGNVIWDVERVWKEIDPG